MQQQWIESYKNEKHRKMLFPKNPTGAGKMFLDYLDNNFSGTLLDIGCGNGRNALALSELGFEVYGIDGIPDAIEDAREISNNIDFKIGDLGESWPYDENSFDYAIDTNTFASLLLEDREVYISELEKVLKSRGLFFLYTYTKDDEYYNKFVQTTPLSNSKKMQSAGTVIKCSDDGISRVLYDQEELEFLFKNFKIKKAKKFIRYSKMFDKYFKRNFIGLIFEKQ